MTAGSVDAARVKAQKVAACITMTTVRDGRLAGAAPSYDSQDDLKILLKYMIICNINRSDY
jgi:hypothetical protein